MKDDVCPEDDRHLLAMDDSSSYGTEGGPLPADGLEAPEASRGTTELIVTFLGGVSKPAAVYSDVTRRFGIHVGIGGFISCFASGAVDLVSDILRNRRELDPGHGCGLQLTDYVLSGIRKLTETGEHFAFFFSPIDEAMKSRKTVIAISVPAAVAMAAMGVHADYCEREKIEPNKLITTIHAGLGGAGVTGVGLAVASNLLDVAGKVPNWMFIALPVSGAVMGILAELLPESKAKSILTSTVEYGQSAVRAIYTWIILNQFAASQHTKDGEPDSPDWFFITSAVATAGLSFGIVLKKKYDADMKQEQEEWGWSTRLIRWLGSKLTCDHRRDSEMQAMGGLLDPKARLTRADSTTNLLVDVTVDSQGSGTSSRSFSAAEEGSSDEAPVAHLVADAGLFARGFHRAQPMQNLLVEQEAPEDDLFTTHSAGS